MIQIARHRSFAPQRRLVIIFVAVITVLIVVAVGVFVGLRVNSQGVAKPTAAASLASVSTVHVAATFSSWVATNATDAGSTFSAEHGASKDGGIALRVDSTTPAKTKIRAALGQAIRVRPLTTYAFGAWVRTESTGRSNVAMFMGSTEPGRFIFPSAAAGWTYVTWTYRTPAKLTQLPLRLTTTGPVADFLLDKLTVTTPKKTIIENGSFEEYSAPTQVTNTSLIMTTGQANLGISWHTPSATWTVADVNGADVAHGELKPTIGLGMINLSKLRQGYYTAKVVSAGTGTTPLQTSFMVLDAQKHSAKIADSRFGVNVHIGAAQYSNFETTVGKLGFTSVRSDATWSAVESTKNNYVYPSGYTSAYKELASEGISVLPIVGYSNPLYDENRTPSSPAGIEAFANYTGSFVAHYSSPAVEIYNEFNNPPLNSSSCGVTPACYLPLLKSSYEAVKSHNRATTVVGPVIARYDDAWLTGFYKAGGLKYVDAVSFHPYDYSFTIGPEFLDADLQQANARIKQYNNGVSKPIWITELGWSTGAADYSEQAQAQNLVRADTISFANGVQKLYWYDLVDDGPDPGHESNFGLMYYPATATSVLAPKRSAMSQAILAREIAGKEFTSRDVLNPSTYSYVFGSGTLATRVVWATTPTTVSYVTTKDVTLTTEYGQRSVLRPHDGRVSVQLTGAPVYLDGGLSMATILG